MNRAAGVSPQPSGARRGAGSHNARRPVSAPEALPARPQGAPSTSPPADRSWRVTCGLGLLLALSVTAGQAAAGDWITHPAAGQADAERSPIALQFRREVTLTAPPAHLFVRVSADSRYVLYVNGRRVAAGPSRGDLRHWRYARLDLGPELRPGQNVVAAEVWSDGRFAPMAQISARTAFLLQAEDPSGVALDTGPQWRVRIDASRALASGQDQLEREIGPTYYVAGSPETRDAARTAADFADASTQAADWAPAKAAVEPWEPSPWRLTPDTLPQMLYRTAPAGRVVRVQGVAPTRFPDGPVQIPANSSATLLVDAGAVQAAYPRLTVSGGAGAKITLTYAESLYDAAGQRLADRSRVEGGVVRGLTDTFVPAGQEGAKFEPFWWRTWRYVEIRVRTGATPVRLDGLERRLTGYPFETDGRFHSSDPELDKIWRIGWDTVKLDAHETFMDTAYWEQLQYVGDSRLMALVSYAASRDRRLPAQAVEAITQSSIDDLPLSRYPANRDQLIPPFALLWVGMLHDYWMHEPDTAVTRRGLPTMRRILKWFDGYRDADGLVGATPGWTFVDWRPGLSEFSGPENHTDNRCVISLMYVGALQQAARLEETLGEAGLGQDDAARARQVSAAIGSRCWSSERGLFANGPDKRAFSQHANALAVLYDVAPPAEQQAIMDRITVRDHGLDAPSGITPTTFYFGFYVVRALEHAGLSDRYFEILKSWRALLWQNFTTWPETPDPSRSDTHAWSAHPTLDLLQLVAGVEPASPGYATVRIRPHLGALAWLDAATAHPAGLIETQYRQTGAGLEGTVKLPGGVTGSFEWGGSVIPLRSGVNKIAIRR